MSTLGDGRWGITIVSDLHLSLECGGGGHDSFEHALHEAGFARLLDHVRHRAAQQGRSWRLVILGDLVDLPGTEVPPPAVAAVLDRIAADHPELFGAVGAWLSAGMQVDVVAGNHDVALLRRAVRERFVDLVMAAGGSSNVRAGITFHPWIYHLPGVLYAEHGSQYHDVNAVPALLGLDGTDDRRPAGRPLTAVLERHRRGQRRRTSSTRPAALLDAGLRCLRLAGGLARGARSLSSPKTVRQRAAYHSGTLRQYAAEVGIDHDALIRIDQLSQASAWSIAVRLLRAWVLVPAARAAPRLLLLGSRRRSSLWQPADRGAYLRAAWPAIHRQLSGAGQEVPYYVFGHTHHPEELTLPGGSVRYLNAGTWVPAGPARPGTFVEITGEPDMTTPIARLMRWDDEVGQPKPLQAAEHVPGRPTATSPWGRRRTSHPPGSDRGVSPAMGISGTHCRASPYWR